MHTLNVKCSDLINGVINLDRIKLRSCPIHKTLCIYASTGNPVPDSEDILSPHQALDSITVLSNGCTAQVYPYELWTCLDHSL